MEDRGRDIEGVLDLMRNNGVTPDNATLPTFPAGFQQGIGLLA